MIVDQPWIGDNTDFLYPVLPYRLRITTDLFQYTNIHIYVNLPLRTPTLSVLLLSSDNKNSLDVDFTFSQTFLVSMLFSTFMTLCRLDSIKPKIFYTKFNLKIYWT